MAKRVEDKTLDSRKARERLVAGPKPYWRVIGRGVHLGYRKGQSGGVWVVRRYVGGKYETDTFGQADDILDADGVKVLDYWQAQARVASMVTEENTRGSTANYTLRQALDDYLLHSEGKPSVPQAKKDFDAHIPNTLLDKRVADITAQELEALKRAVAKAPPRARTKQGEAQRYMDRDMDDPEVQRKRKASANRFMTTLKAALNVAFANGKVASDAAWRRVKSFKGASVGYERYLTHDEATRLINAADPEFRPLVLAALETGARYQEIARLQVQDFNPEAGTLHIRRSKSGKDRHITLSENGIALFKTLAAGGRGSDLILGREWRQCHQTRPMRQACVNAKIDPPLKFHGLRHTWASLAVMAGMPLNIVARNLGHSSTVMVEKHYGHLAKDYVTDAIRQFAPRYGATLKSKVRAIR